MTWYLKFLPIYKRLTVITVLVLITWLLLWPVSIDASGLHVGSLVLPVRNGGPVAGFALRALWRTWMTVTAFVSPVLWVGRSEGRIRHLLWFQIGLLAVLLLPAMLHLKAFPDGRLMGLAVAHMVILNGFLLLLTLLVRPVGAGILMILVQLAGPAIRYLNDFREFFPGGWASVVSLAHRELPFYQKIVAMGDGRDTGALWPDLLLASGVLVLEGIRRFRRFRSRASNSD